MENLVILGIVVLGIVWYFKNKKNKSQDVKNDIQEESTESCCSKHSEDKVEVKDEVKDEVNLSKTIEDKVEVSLEKYPTELGEYIKISNLEVTIINLPSIIEGRAPNNYTLDNLKELAKDIYLNQVEPLSYATIYKHIANHYGYRTWKDFKKVLES